MEDAEDDPKPIMRVRPMGDAVVLYLFHPLMFEKPQGAVPLPEFGMDNDLIPDLIPYIALTPNDAWKLANIIGRAAMDAGAITEDEDTE